MQYKVISLSGFPLNTGYKIKYVNGQKIKEIDKIALPSITGSDSIEIENSIEGILNYLGAQGWDLVNFEDSMFVLKK